MTLKEFFKKTYPYEKEDISRNYHVRPPIICNDGFKFSVQASEGHYCAPRVMLEPDETYYEAEIGYPSEEEPLIMEFAEEPVYTNTVYPYVPTNIIEQVLEKHGGIDVEKTFQ